MAKPKKKPAIERLTMKASEFEEPEAARPPEPEEAELPEPRGTNFLSRLLTALPAAAQGVAHLAAPSKGTAESRANMNRSLQQATQSIEAQEMRADAQARANARNRQQQAARAATAERQARMDADTLQTNAAKREETGLNIQKGRRTEAEAGEANDPNSPKNVAFRAQLEKTEPGVWSSIPEEQRKTLRLKDADAIALSIAESKRGQKLTDDKDKIKYQQQMEKEYDTSKPTVFYSPMSPVSIDGARVQLETVIKGMPENEATAYRARLENVKNLAPQDQGQAVDRLLKDAAGGRPKNDTAGTPPPDGWQVIDTPGSKNAWESAQRDAKGRDAVRGVTTSLPGIKNNLKRMAQLRRDHGVEMFKTKAASEYENLRTATIGYLNRAISDAGVLNKGEYEVWRDRLLEMGPQMADLQRAVGMGDPVLENLQGAHDAMDSVVANTAGAYGLRQVGKSAGQSNVADNATQVGGVTPGQDATIQVRNKDGRTLKVERKNLARARADGYEPIQ
jgi:hypothetical protein